MNVTIWNSKLICLTQSSYPEYFYFLHIALLWKENVKLTQIYYYFIQFSYPIIIWKLNSRHHAGKNSIAEIHLYSKLLGTLKLDK